MQWKKEGERVIKYLKGEKGLESVPEFLLDFNWIAKQYSARKLAHNIKVEDEEFNSAVFVVVEDDFFLSFASNNLIAQFMIKWSSNLDTIVKP